MNSSSTVSVKITKNKSYYNFLHKRKRQAKKRVIFVDFHGSTFMYMQCLQVGWAPFVTVQPNTQHSFTRKIKRYNKLQIGLDRLVLRRPSKGMQISPMRTDFCHTVPGIVGCNTTRGPLNIFSHPAAR